MEIDVYSDVVCPWCFIGMRRLESVIAAMDDVVVRHHPYVLQPDAPAGGVDLQEMLRSRYGADPAAMFERVEAVAREAGIPLDLSQQRMTYATFGAHTLLRHASPAKQRALLDALFSAYFLDARNIADPAVLAEIASKHGFAEDEAERLVTNDAELAETRREVQEAGRRGVRGVPLFIFNNRLSLSGAQPPEVLRDALAKAGA